MTERLNPLSYRRNLHRRSTSKATTPDGLAFVGPDIGSSGRRVRRRGQPAAWGRSGTSAISPTVSRRSWRWRGGLLAQACERMIKEGKGRGGGAGRLPKRALEPGTA